MVVLVAGSRNYYDYNEFSDVMDYTHKKYNITEIVSGGARGADSLAERYAKENNIPIKVFKANWDMYGNAAGYIRNAEMHNYLKDFEDRMCICFWDGQSRGTAHNFKLSKNNNTKLVCYNFKLHKVVEVL
jgi:hypothetical protein